MNVSERFLKYVRFDTQSDENSESCPSTDKQKLLGAALVEEMLAMGIADALLDMAMQHAKKWNFNHLYLSTAQPLTAARKKYAALGFAVTRTETMTDWTNDGTDVIEEFWEMDQ